MADPMIPPTAFPRRSLAAAALLALVPLPAAASPAPSSGRLAFSVRRNGQPIGRQQIGFHSDGETLTAHIDVDLLVRFGPVTLLAYRHQSTERWRSGRFDSLETHTITNGASERVSAHRTEAGVAIEATKRRLTAPASAAPLSHWNPAAFAGPLFNPQTGALMNLKIRSAEDPALDLGGGRRTPARRFTLSGDAEIVDWYDADGVWAALRAKAKDGSTVEYARL